MGEGDALPERAIGPKVLMRIALSVPFLLLILFLPAGTFEFREAWVLLAVLFLPGLSALVYLVRHDPSLLRRRMETREKEPEQKLIMRIASAAVFLSMVISGLDHRFDWSEVPLWVVVAADAAVLSGYCIFLVVIRENRWASRIVEVVPEQAVVSTGPYALVRHPMYVGALLIYLSVPLALGSWWGVLPATLLVPALAARILHEEEVLARDLEGYRDYLMRVRWRLVPGVW